jgi:hypothetical protein
MLGLQPVADHLVVEPALPSGIGMLALLEIPGRWGRGDAFARGDIGLRRSSELQPQLGEPRRSAARKR